MKKTITGAITATRQEHQHQPLPPPLSPSLRFSFSYVCVCVCVSIGDELALRQTTERDKRSSGTRSAQVELVSAPAREEGGGVRERVYSDTTTTESSVPLCSNTEVLSRMTRGKKRLLGARSFFL